MHGFINMSGRKAWGLYLVLDVFAVGMGMGVPIFAIMLGFPTGWYITRRIIGDNPVRGGQLRTIHRIAAGTVVPTLAMMMVIWLPPLMMLRDPGFDPSRFGHPNFLFDPLVSFFGWIVLMVVVSPVLQYMATVTAAFVTVSRLSGPGGPNAT
jgi:hypothetical protein